MPDSMFALPRWNIFARELENVLEARGLRLSHLDDRKVVFHREKVRRLQQSLKSPGHLTTLNPEEMARLIATFGLSDLEQQRLRASLLATAVEMTLLDRVDARLALMASEDVFNILLAAMRARPEMTVASRIKAAAFSAEGVEAPEDAHFEQALDLLDRASLVLSLSADASCAHRQAMQAREAAEGFASALQYLRDCQASLQESRAWHYWYAEAEAGWQQARALQQMEGAEQ
ncbi:MAG TPA: hypothetical protein VGF67_23360 [Ktedonobacteraceae bacterium]|jgi:hypothetical protein